MWSSQATIWPRRSDGTRARLPNRTPWRSDRGSRDHGEGRVVAVAERRLVTAGGMFTPKVAITDPTEVDAEVTQWLRTAYDQAGAAPWC